VPVAHVQIGAPGYIWQAGLPQLTSQQTWGSPSESFPVHSRMLPRIAKTICLPLSSMTFVSLSHGLGCSLRPTKYFSDPSHGK